MKRFLFSAAVLSFGALASCSCDRGGRKDLPTDSQALDETEATVSLFPDKFPNVARKCEGTTGTRTTTDRNVWIIFNDPDCGGTGRIVVLDNIAGTNVSDAGQG